MTVLTWNTALDLDEGTTQDGVAHDPLAGYAASTLRLGVDNSEHLPMRGVRTWFNSPNAVRYSGTKDQTYIGAINEDGDVVISALNHGTGEWTFFTLNAGFEVDDHNDPAILVRSSDSKIIAFYSKHNTDQFVYYRVSTNAEDITAFGAEQTIDTTDTNGTSYAVAREDASGNIQVFFNPSTSEGWSYVESTDGGSTWSAVTDLISPAGARTYLNFGHWRSGRLDISVTRIPSNPTGANAADVAHCYFDGTSLYDSAGNMLNSGSLPVTDTTITGNANSIIWDSSAETKPNAWTYCCATQLDGTSHRPEVTFIVYDSANEPAIEYHWARHDGTSWSQQAIPTISTSQYTISDTIEDEEGYSGGLVLDPATPGKIVLCELANGHDRSSVKEAVTTDNGSTWTVTTLTPEAIGTGLTRSRPVIPHTPNDFTLGAHADFPYSVSVGSYNSFTNYDQAVEVGHGGMHDPIPTGFITCDEASGDAVNYGISDQVQTFAVNGTTTGFYGATGLIGRNAFSFNGTDNYLAVTGSKDHPKWNDNALTSGMMAIAFKTTSTSGAQSLLGTLDDTGQDGYFIDINENSAESTEAGNLLFWIRGPGGITRADPGLTTINDGNWHLIVFWLQLDGAVHDWVVYYDGVQQTMAYGNQTDVQNVVTNEFDLAIGARQNRATTDQFFPGEIGEFRHYAGVQSATLAQDLWDQFTAGSFVSESKVA